MQGSFSFAKGHFEHVPVKLPSLKVSPCLRTANAVRPRFPPENCALSCVTGRILFETMRTAALITLLVSTSSACGGGSASKATPVAPGGDEHYTVVCEGTGHPQWTSEPHPTSSLAEDEAAIHAKKFPGHAPRVERVAGH